MFQSCQLGWFSQRWPGSRIFSNRYHPDSPNKITRSDFFRFLWSARTVFATSIKFEQSFFYFYFIILFFNLFIYFNIIDCWTLSINITNGIILVACTWSKNHMNNCHLLEYAVVKLIPNPTFKMATRTRLHNPQLNICLN